ncbi:MAG: hypothetical protein Q9169_005414 [Polycauliona sp. 2 TL-2023]
MAPHICIIGAGVSGLRCATVLLEYDYDVTIFEARNRIGGRVSGAVHLAIDALINVFQIAQSDQMGTLEVDITGHNPIIELAKETGTPLHLWKENTLLVDSKGHLVPSPEANTALKQVWELLDKASEYSRVKGDSIEPCQSLYSFFEDSCKSAVQRGEITERERELILAMSQMWGAYVGDGVEHQSLKFFYLEDYDCFIPTNYQKIVARIAALPLAQAQMRYDTSMASVETSLSESRPVCVTTSNGKAEYFDEVVITTPLGWLKKHKESIHPLSPRIRSAIDSISFGRLEKVLIEFPTAFWECEVTNGQTDPDDVVSFVHWLSPLDASQSNSRRWRLECVSFHAFETPYRRNILLFYTFGDCSTHITNSICGLKGTSRDEWLQGFFEPYYSTLPGYRKMYAPTRFLATEWCNDEFAGNGCYSNFQAGMTDAADDVEAIRHGMPEQHIYFAGEHTAPFDGLGTVAGAYTSGEKIAKRIIESKQSANGRIDCKAL